MNIKIIGSGGCVSTPKPCCKCPVCVEARAKGFPYARTGCSLFIEEGKILFDTPEDICYALNNAQIDEVKRILYSHSDPDHTMGMRVVEQLRINWLAESIGEKEYSPIEIVALPTVLEDIKQQKTRYGSVMGYYERVKDLVTTRAERCLTVDGIRIDFIPVDNTEHVTVFVITKQDKKVIYAPCDVKPFPHSQMFYNADLLIIGNTIVGDKLQDGFVLKDDNSLRNELFVMDEVIDLKNKYGIKDVIITHLEEDWGKSYDDYKELEKVYSNIRFAFDGMNIVLK